MSMPSKWGAISVTVRRMSDRELSRLELVVDRRESGARERGEARCRVGGPLLRLEDHDVALHRREIEADAAQPGEPFRQEPGISVILGEPGEVVVERPEARCRENARLAHRTAEHAPRAHRA